MKNKFDLEFCFKGNRKYVHGTDMFTKVTEVYNDDLKSIDIPFHGITVNNMTFFTEKTKEKEIKVIFRCLQKNDKINVNKQKI